MSVMSPTSKWMLRRRTVTLERFTRESRSIMMVDAIVHQSPPMVATFQKDMLRQTVSIPVHETITLRLTDIALKGNTKAAIAQSLVSYEKLVANLGSTRNELELLRQQLSRALRDCSTKDASIRNLQAALRDALGSRAPDESLSSIGTNGLVANGKRKNAKAGTSLKRLKHE